MDQPVYSAVRPATPEDVVGIKSLLDHYAAMGDLLPRPSAEIETNIAHFRVIESQVEPRQIVACGSLEHFTEELAEVRSLMVSENIQGGGLGKKIVEELIEIAQSRNVRRVMALTYVPEFFRKLGFKTVNKNIFPEKVWGICVNCYKFHNCDEIAVLLELAPNETD